MNYLKCAVCIVILSFIFGSLRTHFSLTAPRSAQPSESFNAEVDDSDVAIQVESKPEDQGFIEKWSTSHPKTRKRKKKTR
jgi:hypothetical protein